MANRLAAETSPYLLQHKDNPVDWRPWGEEAFRSARAEDKPIFLSVGYAACHWCHVMERESFEDPETADLLNENFVSIKVDREERPDVDAIYMEATQAMTGRGGWPMSVFLTPDGRPFYAGTYFPPVDRPGMASFRTILAAVREAWDERREGVIEQSARIVAAIRHGQDLDTGDPPASVLVDALAGVEERWDNVNGGFVGAPKFPPAMIAEFLLREHRRTGVARPRTMAETALLRMARGGLYDQLGGGFHRYSVDAVWSVPHFEKMLYDNALLVPVYLHAGQMSSDPLFGRIATETLDWLVAEMRRPEGGFCSSQDADSEGEEGRFFVWTPEELIDVLGAELGARAASYFGVGGEGNFEQTGATVLHVLEEAAFAPGEIAEVRRLLLAARSERVAPAVDDKVLASWNGLTLSAFAEAARVFGRADYRGVAEDLASFLTTTMTKDGRLRHSWRAGLLRDEFFAEDQAAVGCGLLDLYETTFDERWFNAAVGLADVLLADFADPDGGFFDTPAGESGLVVRPRNLMDNAVPSANSLAADLLARLALFTGESLYAEAGLRAARAGGHLLVQAPSMFGRALSVLSFLAAEPVEIAVVGPDPAAMLDVVRSRYRPFAVTAAGAGDQADPSVPLLARRSPLEGNTTAYVCRGFVCDAPVTDPEALRSTLDGRR